MKNIRFRLLATGCWLLAISVQVFAAEEGGEHGGGSPMEWVWRILNFGILVFILVKFAGKPLKDYFQQRKALIEKSIQEAQEAKALAAKALAEVEERLKLKDREVEEIKAAAVTSGESEKARLIEEGERLAAKILEQAKSNIDYEVKKAKDIIKAEAVEAAMQLAEEKIKSRITKEDQEKLLKASLKLLEGKN
ncbi:MAG: ATP synthase F0 subunit B [Nitrospirae bacterium]|nr:ATP synthase F0 subunit B [Nitrospirota bacterium]